MGKKVLVVDDHQDAINILTMILKKGGYDPLSAKDGVEALQRIDEERPELVLLDVMMPKMDGYEVCQAVKADPKSRHIPILMLSAKTDPASKERGRELGAADYITKPINPTEILKKVKEYLPD
jgi:two-component system alkaline phosphatase synthesis response regulator PhoP